MSSVVLQTTVQAPIVLRQGNSVFTIKAGQGTAPGFPHLAPDGSAAAPSYAFASASDTGVYRVSDRLALTVEGVQVADIGDRIISNIEVVPISVGVRYSCEPPPVGYATEVTYFHYRPAKVDAVTEFNYFLYAEIPTEQTLVGGGVTKTIHKGAGDAHYVALMHDGDAEGGAGFGYEGAMFKNGETAYIATFQGSSGFPESVVDQNACRGYHVLVHDPGNSPWQGGPEWFTSDGLFSAHGSLANAYVVKCSEYVDGTVAEWNFPQIKIMNSLQRSVLEAYTGGQLFMLSKEADAGTPNTNAPIFSLRGHYWTGAAEEVRHAAFQQVTSATGKVSLQVQCGPLSGETVVCQFAEDIGGGQAAIDMQGNQLSSVDAILPVANGSINLAAHHRTVQLLEPTGTTGTLDWELGNAHELRTGSATGDVTITLSNPVQGAVYELMVLAGSTPRAVTFDAGATAVTWEGGTAYTATASVGAIDRVWFFFDGTRYQGWFKKGFA